MADLFDRFVGTAQVVTLHTADSGDTWGPPSTQIATNGAGSVYSPAPTDDSGLDYGAVSSWTPPGADYAASVVYGTGFRQSGMNVGLLLRATASAVGTYTWYSIYVAEGSPDALWVVGQSYTSSALVFSVVLVGPTTVAPPITAGDTLTASVAGSTPVITVYRNGTQIAQVTDSGAHQITGAGSAGVAISSSTGDTVSDVIRTMWAGAIGGPSAAINPSSITLQCSSTHAFSAVGLLPNEVPGFTAGTGTMVAGNYTAPPNGTSDTVTWTSHELPTHKATSAVTLTPGPHSNQGRNGPNKRRLRKDPKKKLDFPVKASKSTSR